MFTGWKYRLSSVVGVIVLTIVAVLFANNQLTQSLFTTYVPLFNRLNVTVLSNESLYWAIALSVFAVVGSLVPLYKPRPRRVLDTIFLAQKRVLVAGFALATLGYFKWSHRLPRATLVMMTGFLAITIPVWFVWIRRPASETERTLVVGDDLNQIARIAPSMEASVIGYLCPSIVGIHDDLTTLEAAADGGIVATDGVIDAETHFQDDLDEFFRLGGLSRLEDVLLEYDVDTVVLAFREADRAEFFGALGTCHDHGIAAKVHREYAESVLVPEGEVGNLADVDLEPWDPLDHIVKRIFDVSFAVTALLVLTPLMAVLVLAIKLDTPGPVLYKQERTAVFGESFPVYKFRTMIKDAEAETGPKISGKDAGDVDPRITPVGQVLRQTHLDEIPQLWSILIGDMSVVGPRPERPELDTEIQGQNVDWSKRWFVSPGLTGLAQINDVTGHEPKKKLRYDIKYIRQQSFWFDIQIVIRQIWNVLSDTYTILRH
ncbi:sugar transferase [Natrarchaeobaculum sulfurireducens]|nr:sugar transferase [Natrarchaeobaculum sulfurireducens]